MEYQRNLSIEEILALKCSREQINAEVKLYIKRRKKHLRREKLRKRRKAAERGTPERYFKPQ